MTAITLPRRNPLLRLGRGLERFRSGVMAVGTKELRGRMRGRRAFAVLTIYLILLGLFAWGVYQFQLNAASSMYGVYSGGGLPSVALSAQIGQSLFSGLLMIETLMVIVLAPAFTSGAISLEREKQTLDLLIATPLSSVALVVGKLASALAYVFLLILASVPLAAIVFLFGGVGPEDLVRAYVLLAAVAIGYGAIGLFISALVKRTQVTTVLTYLTVLALTVGTTVLWVFMYATSGAAQGGTTGTDAAGNTTTITTTSRPPQQLLWLNPFIADLDLICGTSTSGYDTSCTITSAVTGKPYFGSNFGGGVTDCPVGAMCALPTPAPIGPNGFNGNVGVAVCPVGVKCDDILVANAPDVPLTQQTITGLPRDIFWPQSTLAFLGSAMLLTLLAAQLVKPTRWRLRLPALLRLRRRRKPGPEPVA
jgi:ABC-type transport system involved in multi-copper enzyme maturation permease subunit